MSFFERIADRLFWAFVILAAGIMAAFLYAADFFFGKKIERLMGQFFALKINPISRYSDFSVTHPNWAWILQWPLRLLSM